jgi:hypothetical protein
VSGAALLVDEVVARVAPLGLRFWDAATGAAVGDGLHVRATPAGGERTVPAGAPHGTVYVLRDLPGLRAAELPLPPEPPPPGVQAGDDTWWSRWPSAARRPFRIEVDDAQGRFLPLGFDVRLPRRGLVTNPCSAGAAQGVPLFSSPSRVVPGGLAAVRADLWDAVADRPAAWALLEVLHDGDVVGRGMADREGRAACLFSWPEPVPSLTDPPPLPEQSWPLALRLLYEPEDATAPPERPSLCAALEQTEGDLLDDAGGAPYAPPSLEYGRELVLKSSTSNKARLLCRP